MNSLSETDKALLAAARAVRDNAHTPVTKFKVGAALLMDNGEIITGCNVENYVLPVSICAEHAALCSAVSQGQRRVEAVAVVADAAVPIPPCGNCRQILHTFGCSRIVLGNLAGDVVQTSMEVLLPMAFRFEEVTEQNKID